MACFNEYNTFGVAAVVAKYCLTDLDMSAIKGMVFGVDAGVLAIMETHLHKRKERDSGQLQCS